jgi:hypothetical protein
MRLQEFLNILAAIVILTVVAGFSLAVKSDWTGVAQAFLFSAVIIFVTILAKKAMGYWLDCGVEHEILKFSRWGYKQHQHLPRPIPGGIIFPLFFTLFSWGLIKFPAILVYETTALKRRAAKRFGVFSHTEVTEWHHALIGAAGIIAAFLIAIITYFLPANFEYLAKIAIYYGFVNLLPLSKMDGAQIFFGSRVLYTALAVIATIFLLVALIMLH